MPLSYIRLGSRKESSAVLAVAGLLLEAVSAAKPRPCCTSLRRLESTAEAGKPPGPPNYYRGPYNTNRDHRALNRETPLGVLEGQFELGRPA